MDRRTAIKYTSLMTGVTLSSAFIGGFLSGCKPSHEEVDYKPLLLDDDQFNMLKNLSNVIIPATDTPGAVEQGVPELLDTITAKCYSQKDQKKFVSDLSLIAEILNEPTEFNKQKLADQHQNIKRLEDGLEGKYSAIRPAYHNLKGSIAASFLSTEYVGKNLLEYLPVPGQYEPCIPLSSTSGKAYTYE